MTTTRTASILTNRFAGEAFLQSNGLGNYYLVRELQGRLVPPPSTPDNEALCVRAIEDMQSRRAGRWFGTDDEGQWYPMAHTIAQELRW